jgi:hypothetical protein
MGEDDNNLEQNIEVGEWETSLMIEEEGWESRKCVKPTQHISITGVLLSQ